MEFLLFASRTSARTSLRPCSTVDRTAYLEAERCQFRNATHVEWFTLSVGVRAVPCLGAFPRSDSTFILSTSVSLRALVAAKWIFFLFEQDFRPDFLASMFEGRPMTLANTGSPSG